jgi:hypothetical protein
MTEASLHHYADVIERAIALHQPDAVLSISSQCLIHLHTTTPLYMFNDAPWPVFKDLYAQWENPGSLNRARNTSAIGNSPADLTAPAMLNPASAFRTRFSAAFNLKFPASPSSKAHNSARALPLRATSPAAPSTIR